jgi:type II secretory pathway component PulJ
MRMVIKMLIEQRATVEAALSKSIKDGDTDATAMAKQAQAIAELNQAIAALERETPQPKGRGRPKNNATA